MAPPKTRPHSVAQLLTPAFLRAIKRLDLRAKVLVDGLLAGRHASPARGFSVEFSDYREYVPGDDVQHIDWRVYVRTDQYYVKRYQAETNLRCTILVDASASMDYASPAAPLTKYAYAQTMAAALALVLVRQRDRVGLMIARDGLACHIPPRSRRSHLHRIFEQLARARPEGAGRMSEALRQAAGLLKRRGLVIVLSDFLPPAGAGGAVETERLCREIGHLAFRGHDVVLFQVLDPAELSLPFEGEALFVDPESGLEVPAQPDRIRSAYQAAINGLIDRIAAAAGAHGAEHYLLTTETPFDRALTRFLAQRKVHA